MKTVVFKITHLYRSGSDWGMRVSRQDIRASQNKDEMRLAHHVFSCSYPQYYPGREFLYLRGRNFEEDTSVIIAVNDPLQNVFDNILLSPFLIETERLSL